MKIFAILLILTCSVALVCCKNKSGLAKYITNTDSNISEPNIDEPNESASSEHPTIPDADIFEVQGTVVHRSIEGGFFAIDGDDGRKYDPMNLPESFRKDGLKVKVKARLRRDAMSIHMYGAIIEVVDIAAK